MEKKKQKNGRYQIFLAVFLLFAVMTGVMFLLRFRNSVRVFPSQNIAGAKVVAYRQDDASWADEKLGSSEYTIKTSGCLVSCIASALTMSGETVETPHTLNQKFSENQVYDSAGNIQWEKIDGIEDYKAEVCSEVSTGVLEEYLKDGRYPIVRVRMHGYGNFHYVLVVGAENGGFLCMDPLRDDVTNLSAYGNRIYAVRCVY